MKLNRFKMTSIVQGLLVIAAGVLLYLFNTNVLSGAYNGIEYKDIVFSWPMLLVAIGFSLLFSFRNWGGGLTVMLIGGFFLLKKMNIEALNFITDNGWAIALILIGFIILWKSIMGGKRKHCWGVYDTNGCENDNRYRFKHGKHKAGESGYIERNYVFGGSNEKLDIPDFKGGDINCVFGGMELDLADCQLAEGVNFLEINVVFGGVVIYAPIEWNIQLQQSSVLGQFKDSRPQPNFEIDNTNRLIIKASAVFGGGEIKCRNQK